MASFFDDDPQGAGDVARAPWREQLHRVIFQSDTPSGRAFDLTLLWVIVVSVLVVMLDSEPSLASYQPTFRVLEWSFTALFTLEYLLRLVSTRSLRRYTLSFYGLVDLLSLLPSYLMAFQAVPSLLVVRSLRLLRVFRILRLGSFLAEGRIIADALVRSRRKIAVFLSAVLVLTVIMGAMMYAIEGAESGFTSIPMSIYWAIVTLTTVGYGDIAPATPLGRLLASIIMITGYAIIAVPTGIVTVELTESARRSSDEARCPACGAGRHTGDARFCRLCGEQLVRT